MAKNKKQDKPKDFKSSFLELLKYLKPYAIFIFISSIFSVGSTLVAICGPQKISDLTNEIKNGINSSINIENIFNISKFLIIVCLISIICQLVESFIMIEVSQNFTKKLRFYISKKINKIPLKIFDSKPVGDILSIITNDVDTVFDGLHQGVGKIVYAIVTLIGILIMMFLTNWQMSLTVIISTFFGFFFVGFIMKKSQKYFDAQQKNLGRINGYIEEMYSGHNIICVYNCIEETKKQFDLYNDELYKSSQKSSFLGSIMQPLMHFINNFGYVAVCVIGAILMINNIIDLGTIVSFILYVRLFSNPLSTITNSISKLQTVVAAAERIFNFLKEEELSSELHINKKINISDVKGDICFENVKFKYDNELVIKDFSADIKAGQKVAIVGPTGAGKTTLVNLLMKFYEITSGDIKIDGYSINEITRENVHNLFCMVLQNTWIFKGTLKENIIYNKIGVSDEEVINACKIVNLDTFINSLPDKYDTVLNEDSNLSEGQKQLITIARAILDNSPFLILDEATSSVDRKTEEIVQKAMDDLTKNRTSFIIAHRLSTIQNADLILVLKNGDIVEQGTHDELLLNNGFYSELYNSQFEV